MKTKINEKALNRTIFKCNLDDWNGVIYNCRYIKVGEDIVELSRNEFKRLVRKMVNNERIY